MKLAGEKDGVAREGSDMARDGHRPSLGARDGQRARKPMTRETNSVCQKCREAVGRVAGEKGSGQVCQRWSPRGEVERGPERADAGQRMLDGQTVRSQKGGGIRDLACHRLAKEVRGAELAVCPESTGDTHSWTDFFQGKPLKMPPVT